MTNNQSLLLLEMKDDEPENMIMVGKESDLVRLTRNYFWKEISTTLESDCV